MTVLGLRRRQFVVSAEPREIPRRHAILGNKSQALRSGFLGCISGRVVRPRIFRISASARSKSNTPVCSCLVLQIIGLAAS